MENKNYNKALYEYLSGFITENRLGKFQENIQYRTRYITIVLEDIFQPHNASAVLRSADCLGIQDIHIIENENKYHVNPDVALGSSKWLTLIQYNKKNNNTQECILKLKKQGYKIIATSSHENDYNIDELLLDNKIALFFGTELHGLSPEVINNADSFVKIPMHGFTESFNISVSAAICMYSLTSRLRDSQIKWQLTETEKNDILVEWLKNSIKSSELIEADFKKKSVL